MSVQLEFTPAACTAGGIILGVASVARLFCTGRVFGISGFLRGLVLGDFQSSRPLAFAGLLAGAALMNAWLPSAFEPLPASFSYGRAVGAGLLVGFGTSLGHGCTSGHGICGNARLSPRSMVFTGIFMAVAIAIAAASNLSKALDIAKRGVVVRGAMDKTAAITAAVVAPGGAAVMALLALAGAWVTRQTSNNHSNSNSKSAGGAAAPKKPSLGGAPGHGAGRAAWSAWGLEAAAELMAGVLFASGLGVSLMTHQTKVAGFLGIYYFPAWDLSLPFVMGAALFLALPAYQVALRLKLVPRPALKQRYDMPTATDIDGRLLLGGVMFGAGWGLSGICPGPALVNLVSRACTRQLGVLVGSMLFAIAVEVHVLGWVARAGLLPRWLQWLAEPTTETGSSACGGRVVTIRRGAAPSGRFASPPVLGDGDGEDVTAPGNAVAQLKAGGEGEDLAAGKAVLVAAAAGGDVELDGGQGIAHAVHLADSTTSGSCSGGSSPSARPTAQSGGAVPPPVCG